jgi:hypothetical protein
MRMTEESTFNPDDYSFRRNIVARRASRLAVYAHPIAHDVQRALAIEDATEATQRALFAIIDALFGEADVLRVGALKGIYVDFRMALDELKKLES